MKENSDLKEEQGDSQLKTEKVEHSSTPDGESVSQRKAQITNRTQVEPKASDYLWNRGFQFHY